MRNTLTPSALGNFNQIMLKLGLFMSFAFIAVGGFWYLINHGFETYVSHGLHIQEASQFSGAFLITIGLYMLLALQLLRVLVVGFHFLLLRNWRFVAMNLFIFAVILFSFLFPAG
jgi:uncharacterized membrane protein